MMAWVDIPSFSFPNFFFSLIKCNHSSSGCEGGRGKKLEFADGMIRWLGWVPRGWQNRIELFSRCCDAFQSHR